MQDAAIEAAAQHLHALQRARHAGPRVAPDWRPRTPADGWRVQRRVSALRSSPVIGWKCGLPLADRWVAAALHEAVASGGRLQAPAGPNGAPRIEPEWAFELNRDLPVRPQPYGADEVNAAIGALRLAVEVLGCRYADAAQASGPELMADGLWHQSLVLGPPIAAASAPASFVIEIEMPGRAPLTLPACHPDGDARRPLQWLAEFLRAQGVGLRAGQVVISGSLAGVIELPFDQPARVHYAGLGSVALTVDRLP